MTAVFVNAPIASAPARAGRLPAGRLAAFSALALPIAAAQMPLNVYLPAIYSQHFGLSLGLVGLIFFVEKLWGAAADPVVGALSDRTRTRYGRRRPWILAGTPSFHSSAVCSPPGHRRSRTMRPLNSSTDSTSPACTT